MHGHETADRRQRRHEVELRLGDKAQCSRRAAHQIAHVEVGATRGEDVRARQKVQGIAGVAAVDLRLGVSLPQRLAGLGVVEKMIEAIVDLSLERGQTALGVEGLWRKRLEDDVATVGKNGLAGDQVIAGRAPHQ